MTRLGSAFGNDVLSAEVAEKLFGWKWMRYHDLQYILDDAGAMQEDPRRTLCDPEEGWLESPRFVEWNPSDPAQDVLVPYYQGPDYAVDLGAAGLLIEEMEKKGWGHKHLVHSPASGTPTGESKVAWAFMQPGQGPRSLCWGESAELARAICLAALKTKGKTP